MAPEDFPIIDVSRIDEPDSKLAIAQQVTASCQKWGFLFLKNHTIAPQEISDLFATGKYFFSLPESEKEPWPITSKDVGCIGALKDLRKDDKMSMWFGGIPGSLHGNAALPPFWHDGDRIERIEAFKHKCHELVLKLLTCFALSMGLPDPNFFAKAHREEAGNGNSLRLLLYPARSLRPEGTRMQPHTDSGSVTLLFQKQPGLEIVNPAGEWVKAPCVENAILVNIGDSLAFWSGKKLKATLHRVSFEGLPHDRERQSMAYFGMASPDTVLRPLLQGQKMGKYSTNGLELEPGITMGELNRRVMRNIYGAKFIDEDSRVEVDAV